MLKRSIESLLNLAENPQDIEIMLAFDNDDKASLDYCVKNILPMFESKDVDATIVEFTPMGYVRLHEYVNALANVSNGHWLMFWNDDAIMETKNWDSEIKKHTGKFLCLRMLTHRQHPYAIFPIVPKDWFYLLGHLSNHQLTDATISQISYIVGIMQNLDVWVTHDRYDITGNNKDETFLNRPMLEGNHDDPKDFNYLTYRNLRLAEANKIAWYLKSIGQQSQWFEEVVAGKRDPWENMLSKENDPNNQVKIVA